MRQAGRYMPEFRAMRKKYSFLELCHQPDLAAEVTLLPLKSFELDAAILFSDILVILEALGAGVQFKDGIGPVIENPVHSRGQISNLRMTTIRESLKYVPQAIQRLKACLTVPLLGFCGAPFTVASYLIEGGSSQDLKKTKQWLFRDPEGFHQLLDVITTSTIEYLQMQVEAGVDAIQIFDTWATHLAHAQWKEFALPYQKRLVESLRLSKVPVILFSRGTSVFAEDMASLKPACVSVDWQCDLKKVADLLPKGMAIQGNLDPDVLYAPKERIESEAKKLLNAMKGNPGYIFNLGHGIKPDIPTDAVRILINTIHNHV